MAACVKCTHTTGNRVQECVLVRAGERVACLPTAPAENALGKLAVGLAMTAVGVTTLRLGGRTISSEDLAVEDLEAAVVASGGFYLGSDWVFRTGVPLIGTMLMHGAETITTRERVPAALLAHFTPHRAPLSAKPVKVASGIGAAVLVVAGVVFLATGSVEALLGIGFWGVVPIAASLYVWWRLRRS